MSGKCIVLATFGSLGDLHPYIALALGLQQRGHEAILATSPYYRRKVEALGIGFRAVRPDHPDPEAKTGLIRAVMHHRDGPEFVIRTLMMPVLRESYEDTLAAAAGAHLLVGHPLTFAVRLVAEKTGIPWVSTVLAPLSFFSAHDPPVLPRGALGAALRHLSPFWFRLVFRLARRSIRAWPAPWHHFRAEIRLPATADDPLFEGQHAPALVLALFSPQLARPQPDWPPRTIVTGFLFFDRDEDGGLVSELGRFLDAGAPPIVFTLGSSAVLDAGAFYEQSAAAARMLGRRAVLLIGKDPRNRPAALPEDIAVCDYAPFSEIFPRAAAIVHQGGIGTTAQAMRAGRPMLVMPYAHDQPDNAERVRRLGIARTTSRHRYTAARAAAELQRLLDEPAYAQRAAEVGRHVQQENGVATACDALEALLARGTNGL